MDCYTIPCTLPNGDMNLVLPTLNLCILDADKLIMVQQVRLIIYVLIELGGLPHVLCLAIHIKLF